MKHRFEETIRGTFGNMHHYKLTTANKANVLNSDMLSINKRIIWLALSVELKKENNYRNVMTLGEYVVCLRVGENFF